MSRNIWLGLLLSLASVMAVPAFAQQQKPNILVIMADDIGYWNISAYNRGMMGYHTPDIDRIANEGAIFTDYYGQQSCTAGRAAFITGQSPMRTGLLKVGLPGAKEGLSDKDPTLAELLKPLGYTSGQFGKNHLGDRNEFLPTVHGFDEFFGASIDFMDRANKAGKPFFVWFNSSRMHIYTHLKPESKGKTGYGVYADGMVEHDGHVGQLLGELKK